MSWASIVVVHGFGEHGAGLPYRLLRGWLEAADVRVAIPDLPGHGSRPGARGHIRRWDEYRDTVLEAAHTMPAPRFLAGLSLGGLIVLEAAIMRSEGLSGIISAAPPLGRTAIPSFFIPMARVMGRVWPGFSMASRLNLEGMTRDRAAMEEYARDPLFHQRGSAGLLNELLRARERVHAAAPRFPLPLLMLWGSADRICASDGGFYERCAAPEKDRQQYRGAMHHLFLESNREEIYRDVVDWMRARSGADAGAPHAG